MTPTQWLQAMRQIWLAQTPDRIGNLLADPLEYHEDPIRPPMTRRTDVINIWQEIKNQNIEYVEIDMLHEHNNIGMALWRFKEIGQPEHIGSYYLELDDNGKCQHFRQWWNSGED